jgi:tyrocidine synthetase-3
MTGLKRTNLEDMLALTPLQEGMLYHYLKDPNKGSYALQLTLEVRGRLDVGRAEKAWNRVIRYNEMLRTLLRWEKLNEPVQIVMKQFKFTQVFHDFSPLNTEKKEIAAENLKKKDKQESFDLRQVPFRVTLCKLETLKHIMIISSHHILYDGWSTGIILKEFFLAYHSPDIEFPEKPKFKEFVRWICSQDRSHQKQFWSQYLEGVDSGTEMSFKKRTGNLETKERGVYRKQLTGELQEQLDLFVRQHKLTAASILYTSWGLLLQRYNNCDDILFGTTVSGRSVPLEGVENCVGLFINTLPLRFANPGLTVLELVAGINGTLQERKEYEGTALTDIKEFCGIDTLEELFDSLMIIENYPLGHLSLGTGSGLSVSSYSMLESTHYDLNISILPAADFKVLFDYNGNLFEANDIERLAGHFIAVVRECLENPGLQGSRLDFLPREERKKVLQDFNRSSADYALDKPVYRLLEDQVERTPDRIALVGTNSTAVEAIHESPLHPLATMQLSYRQFYERSDSMARGLSVKGVKPGEPVALLMERSIEMVISIFAILKAGAAYLPIDPGYPQERVDYILADSGARMCLKDLNHEGHEGHEGSFYGEVESGNLAYIIYTSGTTGRPKGVVVEHRSVVNQLLGLQRAYPLHASDSYLFKTAYVFDVSVTELFGWFFEGGRLVILPAGAERDPREIVRAIAAYSVTHINFVPSMFNVFAAALDSEMLSSITSLKYIFLAGEALLPEVVNKFRRLRTGIRLENLYGPTEATIYGSRYSLAVWSGKDSIPIGKPVSNAMLYILDNHQRPQPVGIRGELYIGGAGVARGYLNQPELTAEKFVIGQLSLVNSGPNDQCPMTNDRLYRTGDSARWLPDGNIEFLGRLDLQLKVRGFRIEPAEIESRLLAHESVRESVVIAHEDTDRNTTLCAYYVSDSGIGVEELRTYLASLLPAYMIPAYFVPLEHIPLTPSGKVDRRAFPEPAVKSNRAYAGPEDDLQRQLVVIWSQVLGLEASVISIDSNFFHLGGHSLKITGLIGRIHKTLGVEIALADIFYSPTIRQLSAIIRGTVKTDFLSLAEVEEREYYPLPSAQKRLHFLQQMEPGNIAYNVPLFMVLEGNMDTGKLEDAFKKLILRHESLRTSFLIHEGDPVQRIHEQVTFSIEWHNAENSRSYADRFKEFVRPFDLTKAPLLRVGLIKENNRHHLMMIDMHHIITDGTSSELLARQFVRLYQGAKLPGLRYRYRDFCLWQVRRFTGSNNAFSRQKEYWLEQFKGEVPVLSLPVDFMRPLVQDFSGSTVDFRIDVYEAGRLRKLALAEKTSLFMVLLAIYNVLLAKVSGQEDIVVATGIEGRNHEDLRQIIGMFVNTLALRNFPRGDISFRRFLAHLKTRCIEAFENQDYPFEDLVENLSLKRDTGRNPIFDTMFQFNAREIPEIRIPGLVLKPYPYRRDTAKFDLTLWGFEGAGEDSGRLLFRFEYCTKLFKEAAVGLFVSYFKAIVSAVLQDRDRTLVQIRQIPLEEREHLLLQMNRDLDAESARIDKIYETQALQHLLIDHFNRYRDKIAIEYGERFVTYRELHKRSLGITSYLQTLGIRSGTVTGILLEDRAALIIAMVGVLKAGCVFAPLDAGYPQNRLEIMIRSTEMKVIISDRNCSGLSTQWVLWDDIPLSSPGPVEDIAFRQEDKIYIYFTSGSTGVPKAILGRNLGLLHFIDWEIETFGIDDTFRFSQLSAPGFDAFLRDVFVPLCTGGTVCIPANKEVLLNAAHLQDWLERSQVNLVSCVPALFRLLISNPLTPDRLRSLEVILFSGERITGSHLEPWFKVMGRRVRLVNLWGTSETTLAKTFRMIEPEDLKRERVPVGKPIAGANVLVLDERMELCQPLVTGELYIRTPFRSFGYYNDDDANRERFIPNPFTGDTNDLLHKTGDLGRLVPEGFIDLLGRNDRQVKIRGIRIEPEEIETILIRHQWIKEAVVIKKVLPGNNEVLCAYFIMQQGLQYREEGVRKFLEEKLPEHMVPNQLRELRQIPRTPNGKVDYDALAALEDKTCSYAAPGTETEKKLAALWTEILQRDSFAIHDHFFTLGGNSLNVMNLIAFIHRKFDVRIPLGMIFNNPTIEKQAKIIESFKKENHSSLEPVEKKEYYELSSGQKRMYILQQSEAPGNLYNMFEVLEMEGEPDLEKLELIFGKLILRHESFRTAFRMIAGQPVQCVSDTVDFAIEYGDAELEENEENEDVEPETIVKDFIRPFDLSRAPLLRVGLFKTGTRRHLLIVDMHHIIADGASAAIVMREFMALYREETLAPLNIQYKDFSAWQNSRREREELQSQENFWRRTLDSEIPQLRLPYDFPRPLRLKFEGNSLFSELKHVELSALKDIAREKAATLFMVLLALYTILLSKLSGQQDILVGIPTAGRRHADLRGVTGMFVNTLVIKSEVSGNLQFRDYLEEVKKQTLDAFENQDYQFEDLLETMSIPVQMGRSPIFDALFVLQNTDSPELEIPGLKLNDLRFINPVSKFDISFNCRERENTLVFFIEYRTALFREKTVKRFVDYFKEIVSSVVKDRQIVINDIGISHRLTAAQPKKAAVDFQF